MVFIVTELEGRQREEVFGGESGKLLSMHKLHEATNIGNEKIVEVLDRAGIRRQAVKTPYGTAQTVPIEAVPILMQRLGRKRNQSGEILYPWARSLANQIARRGFGEVELPVPRLGGVRRRLAYRSPNS